MRVAQYEWQFITPFPCTAAGSTLTMKIGVKGVKTLPKSKSVNITQVRFTLDKRAATDTKAPWTAGFNTVELPSGTGHSLRAFISYKPLTGGKTKVAVLKATGLICP